MNKIYWGITWLALSILKRSLRYRISGENVYWLQNVATNRILVFNRIDFILDQCMGKRVLHIGFTDYPFTIEKIKNDSLLHVLLQQSAGQLLGLDNDINSIQQYSKITKDENVVYGDITSHYPAEAINFKPGIILLSEVLEHLKDPYKAVDILYEGFPGGTRVLVTVPNHSALDTIAASLAKTESIHPHHHWYFSPYTLRRLFDDKRFHLEQLHFGMYYQHKAKINFALKQFPFTGDCIMAIFSITKTTLDD